jgi:prefoldin subunit 5
MNIKKELVKSLKNLVSAYFGQMYTDSQIKISDKVVGGIVEMIAADGTLSPAADGDYAMEDGFSFTVKDGAIISIIGEVPIMEDMTAPIEPIMTGETPANMADVVPAQPTPMETQLSDLEDKVMSLEEKIASIEDMLQMMHSASMESEKTLSTFNKVVDELNNNIKTLASVPVEFSKVDNTVKNTEDKQEKLNNLVNILNKKSK